MELDSPKSSVMPDLIRHPENQFLEPIWISSPGSSPGQASRNDAAPDVIASKRLCGNQIYILCSMMAHNLSREIQMIAAPWDRRARSKRPASWLFERLDTLRHRIIQRTGRLTRPQGELKLTMSANQAVRKDLLHFMDIFQKAA